MKLVNNSNIGSKIHVVVEGVISLKRIKGEARGISRHKNNKKSVVNMGTKEKCPKQDLIK